MLIAKIQNNLIVEIAEHTAMFPNHSFPVGGPNADFLTEVSCKEVKTFKDFDIHTQRMVNVTPYMEGNFVYTVAIENLSVEELAEKQAAKKKEATDAILAQARTKLDEFAQTRGYDSMLSACTYAGSAIDKFAAEGYRAVQLRDAYWDALFTIMAQVEAGTRAMPEGLAAIEAELPQLTW